LVPFTLTSTPGLRDLGVDVLDRPAGRGRPIRAGVRALVTERMLGRRRRPRDDRPGGALKLGAA
jgi:hypothetical protein